MTRKLRSNNSPATVVDENGPGTYSPLMRQLAERIAAQPGRGIASYCDELQATWVDVRDAFYNLCSNGWRGWEGRDNVQH